MDVNYEKYDTMINGKTQKNMMGINYKIDI